MKNPTSTLSRLAAVFIGALALGACSRAEYATLPRSASYLGSTPVARQRAVAAPVATATVAPAASALEPTAPVATPVEAVAAVPTTTSAPEAAQPAPAVVAEATPVAPAVVAVAPKLNLAQRLALHKITKKLDKLTAQAPQLKKHDATASTTHTARIDGNLRIGLVLLLVGLLLSILSGILGTIVAIIGLIFIILWLLDQA